MAGQPEHLFIAQSYWLKAPAMGALFGSAQMLNAFRFIQNDTVEFVVTKFHLLCLVHAVHRERYGGKEF